MERRKVNGHPFDLDLAEEEAQLTIELHEHNRLQEFENAVMEQLPELFFFPRARAPCGHGAQVIFEERAIQSDGEEKDKDSPTTNQTKPTTAHRPRLHHQAEFPLH